MIAENLGNALQLTNILRDLKEDAALQRLYVPLDMLRKHGVATHPTSAIFRDPRFPDVCADLAGIARGYYAEASRLLTQLGWRKMRPAALMMAIYRETLDRLEQRGWSQIGDPIRLSPVRKMCLAIRYGLL